MGWRAAITDDAIALPKLATYSPFILDYDAMSFTATHTGPISRVITARRR